MTLDESIQGMRLRVMKRAEAIGVTAACREAGIRAPRLPVARAIAALSGG